MKSLIFFEIVTENNGHVISTHVSKTLKLGQPFDRVRDFRKPQTQQAN